MQLTSYYNPKLSIELSPDEIILSCKDLSRTSQLSLEQMLEVYGQLKQVKKEVVLEWDVLVDQNNWDRQKELFNHLPDDLKKRVRAKDVGVLHYLKSLGTSKIQLDLETHSHNLLAIKSWIDFFGSSLDRVILSSELSREKLASYTEYFPQIKFEILGLGRILLFYSPRALLSPSAIKDKGREVLARADSLESAHRGFELVQNSHGTFMYNTKDLSLCSYWSELEKMGMSYFRVDTLGLNSAVLDPRNYQENYQESPKKNWKLDQNGLLHLEKNWPKKLHAGFYLHNKTQVLFKKLKNQHISTLSDNYLGQVIEYNKDKHLAINLDGQSCSLKVGEQIKLISPSGKHKTIFLKWMKNTEGEMIEESEKQKIVLIPPQSGFDVKSIINRVESPVILKEGFNESQSKINSSSHSY